jgi:SAM-dependent methyltransferase
MINPFTIGEVCAFWDRVAPIYEPANKTVGYVHTQRFEKTLEYGNFQSGQRVLNIWSRTGNLLPYLRSVPGLDITNREVSPAMMAIAKEKYPTEQFALTDLENLSEFSDQSFDRIVSLETLEHTPKPEIFLRELHRILKPGGLLIMSLPPRGFEIPTRIYDRLFHNHGEGPHRFLWSREVRRLLRTANITLLSHKPAIILPLGNDRLTRASEKILTGVFGKTPLAEFGVRHFYLCTR